MGADIYDWERVHGKGSYQKLIDDGCSEGRHQAGCSHGEPPYVSPAEAALDAAWKATAGMRIEAGKPWEPAQRAEFIVAALRAGWSAVGERAEKAEAKLDAIKDLLSAEHGSWIRMAGIWDVIGDDEEQS